MIGFKNRYNYSIKETLFERFHLFGKRLVSINNLFNQHNKRTVRNIRNVSTFLLIVQQRCQRIKTPLLSYPFFKYLVDSSLDNTQKVQSCLYSLLGIAFWGYISWIIFCTKERKLLSRRKVSETASPTTFLILFGFFIQQLIGPFRPYRQALTMA